MSANFEQIKDAAQLEEFLKQYAGSGVIGSINKSKDIMKLRESSPAAQDYMGMKQYKDDKRKGAKGPIKLSHRSDAG